MSCFAVGMSPPSSAPPKRCGHGAHQHRILRVELIGETGQLLHRRPIACIVATGSPRSRAAIASRKPRLHRRNDRLRRRTEQCLELSKARDQVFERPRNRRTVFVPHAHRLRSARG